MRYSDSKVSEPVGEGLRPSPIPPHGKHRFRTLFLAFLLYTVVACIVLWPLPAQFNTAVPGGKDTDYYQFLWNYWWIGHALSQGQSPLWTDYTLYPHISNLSIHTLAPIWYPVYAVTQPFIGTIASGNLMVLLGFAVTGTAMFAWLRRRLESAAPSHQGETTGDSSERGVRVALAFLGGLAFAFSPYMLTHAAYIQLNLTPLWWFPAIALLWDEIAFPRRLRRPITAVLLGLALWGLWLTDLQFIVWLPFAVGGWVLWTLWANRRERRWLPLIGWGVLSVAIMGALAYMYPLAALSQINLSNTDEFPPAGLKTLYAYSMPPEALIGLAPNIETRTLGHLIPWLTWLAVILLLIRRTRARYIVSETTPPLLLWLLLALIPITFALGPDIAVGETRVPMPYMLLHALLGGQHRIPGRLTGAGLFLLITFLVLAWQKIVVSFQSPAASRDTQSVPITASRALKLNHVALGAVCFVLVVALLYDNGALNPFPTRHIPSYDIHQEIAQDERDFVILDVPTGTQYGWTGIGKGYFSMFYGTVHHHRMVNGWLARIPYSTLVYYMNSPLFSWLADYHEPNPQEMQAAADQLAAFREDWPVGYVIAYRNWIDPYKQTRWIGWLNMQPGFCPAASTPDADLIWWRSQALGCQPVMTETVDMGTPGDWSHIGTGWYDPEVIGGPGGRWAGQDAALRLWLDPDTAYQLTFTALAFDQARGLTLAGGGGDIDSLTISPDGWQDYTVTLPPGALPDGLLYLRHDGAVSAQERGLSDDARPLAAAYTRFTLRPVES
jgi:hypothetical protein